MTHTKLACFIVIIFCLSPLMALGQIELPKSADTAKQCSICHYRWISTFFTEHRGTPLAPLQEEKVVGTREMCLSCHDGSVRDTRDKVCNDPGHRIGNVPSNRVTIPENFPLDDNGAMQCSTCHTPHAIKSKKETLVEFFLRAPNKDSALCKLCHTSTMGGTAKGNHPVEISSESKPPVIIEAGGIFGTGKPNEIICETCHIPHGGINNRLLVLSVEDPGTRSVLCEACHTKKPVLSNNQHRTFSHPLDMLPGKAAQIPKQWANGENVFLGTEGELVCRTCHKPHYAEDREFLLVEHRGNDSLCVQCHQEQSRITGSSHDLRKSAPEEKNVLNRKAQEIGPCASCHLVHQGVAVFMWARSIQENHSNPARFCENCHAQGQCAEQALPGDFSHPMNLLASDDSSTITLPLFDGTGKRNQRGTMSCSTCHDVHNPHPVHTDRPAGEEAPSEMFLRILSNQDPSAICTHCHQEQARIVGTKHDLNLTGTPFTNALGQKPEDAGICSPCHAAHGAATQQYLWPGHPEQATSVDTASEADPHSAVMVMMCTACHSDETVANSRIPEYTFHPAGLVFPESSPSLTWKHFPLFNNTGSPTLDGDISCATCHNPHQWNSSGRVQAPDTATEGTILSNFLRQGIDRKLCAACHGENSLFKFLYFHRSNSRKEPSFPQLLRKR